MAIEAFVDAEICTGCLKCAEACRFKAISPQTLDDSRVVAYVNEDLCEGCGDCETACRFEAIELRGFDNLEGSDQAASLWQ